jgi:hypothetical protein
MSNTKKTNIKPKAAPKQPPTVRHYVVGRAVDPRKLKSDQMPDLVLPVYRDKSKAFDRSEGALVYEVHLKKDGSMTD